MSLGDGFLHFAQSEIADMRANYVAGIGADAFAKVGAMIAEGRASPRFRRFVNGVENAPIGDLRLDGTSSATWKFARMADAAAWALNFVVKSSPRDSGEFADSWFFLVDGAPWTGTDLTEIPPGAEVSLLNSTDYNRKVEMGGMRMRVAPKILDRAKVAVMRKFPSLYAERKFLLIPGGYVLKGHPIRSGLHYDKRRREYMQRHPKRVTGRQDAQPGEPLTYPALIMQEPV